VEFYKSGDLVLIGPNLPHYWTYENDFQELHGHGHAIVVHFDSDFAGNDFLSRPEVKPVADLLEHAHRGLFFNSGELEETVNKIIALPELDPLARLVDLINILFVLSGTEHKVFLAGSAYENQELPEVVFRINRIINFIKKHFHEEDLSQGKLAEMAGLSNSSFSRYFRRQTGVNYIDFLKDIRLSHAYKLLHETDLSVSQVANHSGYFNLSNFNKQFKMKYKCTPKNCC
jgi:AraC-like DNA-binding protein